MSGSTTEGKSQEELDKIASRFVGVEGQNVGAAKSVERQFINKAPGTFSYAVHIGNTDTMVNGLKK